MSPSGSMHWKMEEEIELTEFCEGGSLVSELFGDSIILPLDGLDGLPNVNPEVSIGDIINPVEAPIENLWRINPSENLPITLDHQPHSPESGFESFDELSNQEPCVTGSLQPNPKKVQFLGDLAEVQKDATTVFKLTEALTGCVGIFLRRTHPDYIQKPVHRDSNAPFKSWTSSEEGKNFTFNVAAIGRVFGQYVHLQNEDSINLSFNMLSTEGEGALENARFWEVVVVPLSEQFEFEKDSFSVYELPLERLDHRASTKLQVLSVIRSPTKLKKAKYSRPYFELPRSKNSSKRKAIEACKRNFANRLLKLTEAQVMELMKNPDLVKLPFA